jgi:hypothetical protein
MFLNRLTWLVVVAAVVLTMGLRVVTIGSSKWVSLLPSEVANDSFRTCDLDDIVVGPCCQEGGGSYTHSYGQVSKRR